jgi:hypothetical protein
VSNDFDDDLSLPPALAAMADIGFEYGYNEETDEDEGVDFELFDEFLDAEDTTDWFRSWTGNDEVDGADFRVFGQDGTGGYAAFWLAREEQPLAEQPIVFLGSEGETGVVAGDLAAFLWLVADGSGPKEAVAHPKRGSRAADAGFATIAEKFGGGAGARRSAREVIATARDEFPDFEEGIDELLR